MMGISYSVKIFRRDEQVTNKWSGGTTTEIAIYPENAEYSKRDFTWRISTATIDAEKSLFTPLPGIWRLTMVIAGEMILEHEGHHQILLKPFEQDSYSGEWTTQSKGKAQDFNLMMAENCEGELRAVSIQKEIHRQQLVYNGNPNFHQAAEAFYCINGKLTVIIDNKESLDLINGDMMLLTRPNTDEPVNIALSNKDERTVHVIRPSLYY
jgi:environmental stress-induced protein Ves